MEVRRRAEIGGREVELTHLDRVLWPETGFTKADMLAYYRAAAPALLAHLRGRPLTLARFPAGVHERGWYQTNCRGPSWLRTHRIVGRRGATYEMCVVDDEASLVWVVNQGTVELHPFGWKVDRPDAPTWAVFDLDPGSPAAQREAALVAVGLRTELERLGLVGFVKTTGSFGLHVLVPLAGDDTFAGAKSFVRMLAGRLAEALPDLVLLEQRRSARTGRVLVDWLQNDPTRSTVAAYSLRATPWPLVSAPLMWDEVAAVARGGRELHFSPVAVLERLARHGDLFAPVASIVQRLPPGDRYPSAP